MKLKIATLAAVLGLSLAACGGGSNSITPSTASNSTNSYAIDVYSGTAPAVPYVGNVTIVYQAFPSTPPAGFNPYTYSTWFVPGTGSQQVVATNSQGIATVTIPANAASLGYCFFVGTPLNPATNPNSSCGPVSVLSSLKPVGFQITP